MNERMKKLGGFSASGHSQPGRAAPRVSPGVPQLTGGVTGLWGPVPPDMDRCEGDAWTSAPHGTAVVRETPPALCSRRACRGDSGAGPRCPVLSLGTQHGAVRIPLCVLTSPCLREAHGLSQVRSLGHLLVGCLSTALDLGREPRAVPPRPAALPTFAFCPVLTLDSDMRSSCTNLPTLGNVLLSPLSASDL